MIHSKITGHLVTSATSDLDMLLDVMFMKDHSHSGNLSQHHFKELLLENMNIPDLTIGEIDEYLQKHPLLALKRGPLTRQDLK